MPRIRLTHDDLVHRENQIRKLLNPLTLHPSNPACKLQDQIGGVVLLGAYDGSFRGGPVRDWRFGTISPRLNANYHERWIPISGLTDVLCLSQLYLTFYKKENPEIERELLALHCEPEELRASVAAYKRGPHVHISIAEYPLKDAHIALARGHLDEVLANTSNLMESLQLSILMLRDEVVSRY